MDKETKNILSKFLKAIKLLDCAKDDDLRNKDIKSSPELAKKTRDKLNETVEDLENLLKK